ncbi:hypothetical protein ACFQ9X_34985 [Catenulispora yoronensis]
MREGFVLALRRQCFGGVFGCVVVCPACQQELELEVPVAELGVGAVVEPVRHVRVNGFEVAFRLITSGDLIAVGAGRAKSGPDAGRRLLERTVTAATRDGEPVAAGDLPPDVLDALARTLAEQDPQADVRLDLDCADCGHRWSAAFDAAAHLWAEVDAYARRLVHDVHTLAAAYGWSEDEVLAVGPTRRQCYLELVAG